MEIDKSPRQTGLLHIYYNVKNNDNSKESIHFYNEIKGYMKKL